jgi:hypothetical protein
MEDALQSVREAIDLHVETLLEDGVALPERAPISVHQSKPDYANCVWAVVDTPVEKYFGPADTINITVPRLILARIDDYAKKHGLSRSAFLVESARAAISH